MRVVLDTAELRRHDDQQHAAGRHVTGDHRAGLLQRARFGRTRVVTPAVFCAEAL
jgi:predicted nucleic acid-binding protein